MTTTRFGLGVHADVHASLRLIVTRVDRSKNNGRDG